MKRAKEILDIIKAAEDYDELSFGIRVTQDEHHVGEQLGLSHVWDDGDPTDEELFGTCAFGIQDVGWDDYSHTEEEQLESIEEAIGLAEDYHLGQSEHYYLIAGRFCFGGEEYGEWIISGAVPLCVDDEWRGGEGAVVIACLDEETAEASAGQ